jgi:methyltransferase family protein
VRRRAGGPRLTGEARRGVDRAVRALGDARARPNLGWLAQLTGASESELSEVLQETAGLLPVDEEIQRRHREAGRPHYAQFRAPFELYAMVRLLRPDHVVETGVSSGVSSAHFLLALRRNRHGVLHSIDRPTQQRGAQFGRSDSPVALPPGKATGWAIPDELRGGWDLRLGSSEEILPRLVDQLPSIGLFLHDSLHTPTHLTFELTTVRPKLSNGAVVLADNTVWTGAAFPRFARALGTPMRRRGRTDLVGLRVP